MAELVFILGESGSGKSTSLRNLTKQEVNVVSVTGKSLPLKTDIETYHPKGGYPDVIRAIEQSKAPIVVIDDANYLMTLYEFATINEQGYGKFARNAQGMVEVFNAIRQKESDQIFYIMAHSEQNEDGKLRFKTTGKMVSEKFNPAGITNIVLEAAYDDEADRFIFKTKADGRGIKTPLGMFDEETIDNDLKLLDKTIRDFYKPTKKEK